MQTISLLLGPLGANSRRSWDVFQRQIQLQGSPQAPQRQVVEMILKGMRRDVVRISVSPGGCLVRFGHRSRPNPVASHQVPDESQKEMCPSGPLFGRRSTETCIIP